MMKLAGREMPKLDDRAVRRRLAEIHRDREPKWLYHLSITEGVLEFCAGIALASVIVALFLIH